MPRVDPGGTQGPGFPWKRPDPLMMGGDSLKTLGQGSHIYVYVYTFIYVSINTYLYVCIDIERQRYMHICIYIYIPEGAKKTPMNECVFRDCLIKTCVFTQILLGSVYG